MFYKNDVVELNEGLNSTKSIFSVVRVVGPKNSKQLKYLSLAMAASILEQRLNPLMLCSR